MVVIETDACVRVKSNASDAQTSVIFSAPPAYTTVSGVNGPLVILDQVKVRGDLFPLNRWRCICLPSVSTCVCFAPAVSEVCRDRPPHAARWHQEERAGPGGERLQSCGAGTPSRLGAHAPRKETPSSLIHRKYVVDYRSVVLGKKWGAFREKCRIFDVQIKSMLRSTHLR